MKLPERPTGLPLKYAAQIAFELHAMRGECSVFATHLLREKPLDEVELDECVRLDEALARAHRVLQHTVEAIKTGRRRRKRTKG